MHWHGIFQNGTNWMDGTSGITQCPLPAGKSFLYNFTVENQYGYVTLFMFCFFCKFGISWVFSSNWEI